MRTICAGWRDLNNQRVHEEIKVLVTEDGSGGPDSHGICAGCKGAFLDRLAAAKKEETYDHS